MAAAIFQQAMDTVLADCYFMLAYLDDILIKSVSKEQYILIRLSYFQSVYQHPQWVVCFQDPFRFDIYLVDRYCHGFTSYPFYVDLLVDC